MFSLHERIQRRVCRVAFLVACVVPTALTWGGALYFHRPWQESDWQAQLEQDLHVRVHVTEVSAPRPSMRVFSGLVFSDLRSGRMLAEIDTLQVVNDSPMVADIIRVPAAEVRGVALALQTWLGAVPELPHKLLADRLSLFNVDGEACEFEHVQSVVVYDRDASTKILIQGVLPVGEADAKPETVRLAAERRDDGTQMLQLDCRQGQIATWLLNEVVPGAIRWQGSKFTGVLTLNAGDGSIAGQLQGSIAGIDAQRWIGDQSPHRCQAQCNLDLHHLTWRNDCLLNVEGTLTAGRGTMSHSLVSSLADPLLCRIVSKPGRGNGENPLQFERVGCRFRLNENGLTIIGNASAKDDDCVVLGTEGPLVLHPNYQLLSLPRFVAAFYPASPPPDNHWLPATRASIELGRRLPFIK